MCEVSALGAVLWCLDSFLVSGTFSENFSCIFNFESNTVITNYATMKPQVEFQQFLRDKLPGYGGEELQYPSLRSRCFRDRGGARVLGAHRRRRAFVVERHIRRPARPGRGEAGTPCPRSDC